MDYVAERTDAGELKRNFFHNSMVVRALSLLFPVRVFFQRPVPACTKRRSGPLIGGEDNYAAKRARIMCEPIPDEVVNSILEVESRQRVDGENIQEDCNSAPSISGLNARAHDEDDEMPEWVHLMADELAREEEEERQRELLHRARSMCGKEPDQMAVARVPVAQAHTESPRTPRRRASPCRPPLDTMRQSTAPQLQQASGSGLQAPSCSRWHESSSPPPPPPAQVQRPRRPRKPIDVYDGVLQACKRNAKEPVLPPYDPEGTWPGNFYWEQPQPAQGAICYMAVFSDT